MSPQKDSQGNTEVERWRQPYCLECDRMAGDGCALNGHDTISVAVCSRCAGSKIACEECQEADG